MDVQLSGVSQCREYLALQVVAIPAVEDPFVEDEEAGIDPVVGQPRLLHEASDPARLVPLDRPVGRRQRDGGHGGSPVMGGVEPQE